MAPVLKPIPGSPSCATRRFVHAATIARNAAEVLLKESGNTEESSRYLIIAYRLSEALAAPKVSRLKLLNASPAVLEQSGRCRTLIEMIEAEPDDPEAQLRLAKLLLRALLWLPKGQARPTD